MGISIGEIKPSSTILYNGEIFVVIDYTHVKVARGSASCRVRLKNFKTGKTLDCTLRDSDNIDIAYIEKRKLQYSFNDGHLYHFLDLETYDDLILDKKRVDESLIWLKDNIALIGLFYNNDLINLEFPLSIELKVLKTEPGYKGDTVKQGTKAATLETGLVVSVPLFIEEGETIKVDTRTREYMGRA
ncbi:MAG: elongation factor P [Candidatus Omnitrophota bacterium]